MKKLSQKIVELLKRKRLKLSVVESCTGGMLSGAITSVSGSSKVFTLGLITYSNQSKNRILKVPNQIIKKHGAVSIQCCFSMVNNLNKISKSNIAVSITGIAGPGSQGTKPEGLVWFGMANRHISVAKKRNFGPLGRNIVRNESCKHALNLLIEFIRSTIK